MCNSPLTIPTIHDRHCHFGWDNRITPVHRAHSGQQLLLQCRDAANGYFTAESTAHDVLHLPAETANPVTGPIWIEDASPGDILAIHLEEFHPSGFGWSANIPGFGLLSEDFAEPALQLWHYDSSLNPVAMGDWARVPLKPFAGTLGVAPAAPGKHSIIPPRHVGGNLDIRDLGAGTTLYLPVEVEGALFSIGDTHAAQGDGEICGTAIESAMDVVLTLELIKQTPLRTPRFSTSGPVTRHLDVQGYEAFTGIENNLMTACQSAVRHCIDWLCQTQHMPAETAYMLCSVCGDLRISEVVDAPNWVVSFYFPKVVLS
ncbi:acetamidase/formamidase family protein [Pokkaliibacter sp. CJK22405]|uniref:acetamidase/formamidase family protein n=1 Tax=Pokkaliibacter sp. CJK22405 TaxID=3384615 RepID=UPI0039853484